MSRTRKDARTLALEGLTIVLSILLALFADAAWGYSRDRAQEAEIVAQLGAEFSAAEEELVADIRSRDQILLRTDRWRAIRLEGAPMVLTDSVPDDVARFLRYRFYTPTHPVLDDILSSGRFQLLRSARLRSAILKYEQERARIGRGEDDEAAYANEIVLPFLSSRVDLDILFSDNTEAATRASRQVLALLPEPDFGSLLWGKQSASFQADIWSELLLESIREVRAALQDVEDG